MKRIPRRLLAAILAALLAAAACGHPEACPEPCPEGMYCNYGACVPAHDGGETDTSDDAG
ncbi:MAG: hypothetical protein HY907_17900 [Deltaproteobacteria bacterium]|nr:hypothetical protein [Deltaproteobacteria bacterium]